MALRSNLPSPGFDSSYRVYGEIFSICFVFRSSNSSCITEFFPSFIRLKKKQAFSVHLGSSPALYQLILRTGPKFYQIRVEVLGEFLFVFRRYLLACWERLLKRLLAEWTCVSSMRSGARLVIDGIGLDSSTALSIDWRSAFAP